MRIAHEKVRVSVSATSANLGPGFDSLGLALEMRDTYTLEVTTGATEVIVEGEGAGEVPLDDRHLVVRTIRSTLDAVGAPQCGIRLTCHNVIPHGRGLGSSAAAIVGGIALARGILAEPDALDTQAMLALATEAEGHPDNVAPALLGGVTVGYMDGSVARAVCLDVAHTPDGRPALDPVVLTPATSLATERARSLLPAEVPFASAVFNISRTALLVHALTSDVSLLMDATEDALHQEARGSAMPESAELVARLREHGIPAVISGAGPTVLIPAHAPATIAQLLCDLVAEPEAWRLARVPLATSGVATVLL
ncbi:MAG: homoserine kinase [Dermabacter sp.]|nr:homoserine kinase [Dermabacter sp.]